MDGYRTTDWAAFRAAVIRRDGGACTHCGRGSADGVVLQVHHAEYMPGRKPWAYPAALCITMCKGCHAALHGHIPPKFDWEHIAWDDLGDLIGTCECCGTAIRYVFMISHRKWRPMEVGQHCCDNLTSTQVATDILESKLRYAARLRRFLASPKWREGFNGEINIRHCKRVIRVVPKDGQFCLVIDLNGGKAQYPTLDDAKAKAFEVLESGAFDKYLARRRVRIARRFEVPR